MRVILISILLIIFSALTLWWIGTAAQETHEILGDATYQPFMQEIFFSEPKKHS
jgi:hypothetical protein